VRKWLISGEINYNVCRICSLTLLPPEVLIPTPITLSVGVYGKSLPVEHMQIYISCPCRRALLYRPMLILACLTGVSGLLV